MARSVGSISVTFSIQPSEAAKVAVLLMVAGILIRSEIGTLRQSLGVLGKLALAVGLPCS